MLLVQKHQKSGYASVMVAEVLTKLSCGCIFKHICRACVKYKASTDPLLSHCACSEHLFHYCSCHSVQKLQDTERSDFVKASLTRILKYC